MERLIELRKLLMEWVLTQPERAGHHVSSYGRKLARILFAVGRDLVNGHLTLHAMSLVYTTMLSLVPMLALSFSVLKAFDVQDHFTPMLYGFFEPMGERGLEIHNSVLSFVENIKVGVLGIVGFVLLFYTVISLVQKIERAFNAIWYAPQLRSVGQRLTNYLSVILVGPVVVVTALSVTASTMSSSLVQSLMAIEPFGTLIVMMTKIMPFMMIIAAFTFFYVLMPNAQVNFKSAFVGGAVAGSCWQATSMLFTSFVVGSTNYDAIYSGFAVGILLLIWLYINWLILLVGSSIAFYHQHENHITREAEIELAPELLESVGLDMMVCIARRYEENTQPITQLELEKRHFIPAILTRRIVDRLIKHGLVLVVGEKSDRLAPGRSTDLISAHDVYQALRHDHHKLAPTLKLDKGAQSIIDTVEENKKVALQNLSVRDIVKR